MDEETGDIRWREPTEGSMGFGSFLRSKSFKSRDMNTAKVPLSSIIEIRRGIQTETMKKAGLVDPDCCVSLCSGERTLDLTFDTSEERNYFIRAVLSAAYPKDIFVD